MPSSPHALSAQGYTHATMDGTKCCNTERWISSQQAGLSSDLSLQLDSMKLESLVIGGQHTAVIPFPVLGNTARHTTKDCNTRSR